MSTKRQRRKVGVAGGFFNQMMGNNATEPKVGEGATILMYSDRHAYDVTWVSEDGNQCKIRPCKTKFIGSGYGDERYEYSPDPEAGESLLQWDAKKSKWCTVHTKVLPIKAQQNRWVKEFGHFDWPNGLERDHGLSIEDICFQEGDDEYCEWDAFRQYKLIEGITKEYTNLNPVSIIFGRRDEYRDPSF